MVCPNFPVLPFFPGFLLKITRFQDFPRFSWCMVIFQSFPGRMGTLVVAETNKWCSFCWQNIKPWQNPRPVLTDKMAYIELYGGIHSAPRHRCHWVLYRSRLMWTLSNPDARAKLRQPTMCAVYCVENCYQHHRVFKNYLVKQVLISAYYTVL